VPRAALIALCLAACGYDVDAIHRPDPCTGRSAADTVHFHGRVADGSNNQAIADAIVDASPGGQVTAPTGDFVLDVPLGGMPTPISFRFTAPGDAYPPHTGWFQRPFDQADFDLEPRLNSYQLLDSGLYGGTGPARDPAAATLVAYVVGCTNQAVAGQVLAVDPPAGKIAYFGGGDATSDSGVAYALDVPAGDLTLTIEGGESFELQASPGEVLLTQLLVP
jgi:hypothetical protein